MDPLSNKTQSRQDSQSQANSDSEDASSDMGSDKSCRNGSIANLPSFKERDNHKVCEVIDFVR